MLVTLAVMHKLGWFGASCVVGASMLAACSSSSADAPAGSSGSTKGDKDSGAFERDGSIYDSTASPESGLGEMLFRPDKVYTGTDGTHTFKVPVAVYDSDDDLDVTASDGSALSIAKTTLKNPVSPDGITDNGKYFLITAKKAGTYELTATSKGRTVTASIVVTGYAANRYADGEARYNADETTGDRRGCKTCHVNGLAIDNSPAALATANDQDVVTIFKTGVKPGPSVIKIPNEPGTQHKWDVTDAESDGLVTYLRALDPRGFQ